MTTWHIVLTRAGEDSKAMKAMRNARYLVYRPIMPRSFERRNRLIDSECSMFPGYQFVNDSLGQGWEGLRNSPGVLYFGNGPLLRIDGHLASIDDDDEEMRAVRALETSLWKPRENEIGPSPFEIGQRVQIQKGPWISFFGEIEKLDGRGRVSVLIESLRRRVRLRTSISHLIAAKA